MLKSLSLTWLEVSSTTSFLTAVIDGPLQPGSRRSGTLSLRDLRLSPDLLDSLRLNDLDISLVVRPRNSKIVRATDFADIVVILVNRLGMPPAVPNSSPRS